MSSVAADVAGRAAMNSFIWETALIGSASENCVPSVENLMSLKCQ